VLVSPLTELPTFLAPIKWSWFVLPSKKSNGIFLPITGAGTGDEGGKEELFISEMCSKCGFRALRTFVTKKTKRMALIG